MEGTLRLWCLTPHPLGPAHDLSLNSTTRPPLTPSSYSTPRFSPTVSISRIIHYNLRKRDKNGCLGNLFDDHHVLQRNEKSIVNNLVKAVAVCPQQASEQTAGIAKQQEAWASCKYATQRLHRPDLNRYVLNLQSELTSRVDTSK